MLLKLCYELWIFHEIVLILFIFQKLFPEMLLNFCYELWIFLEIVLILFYISEVVARNAALALGLPGQVMNYMGVS